MSQARFVNPGQRRGSHQLQRGRRSVGPFVLVKANPGGPCRVAQSAPGERRTAVARKRPTGLLEVGWACIESAATGRTEHVPTSDDYPESVMHRTTFTAGGGLGWKISVLTTTRERPCPLKIVVVT